MTCLNCKERVEEHVDSRGNGSRYCLGCGYYEEFQTDPPEQKQERLVPRPLIKRIRKNGPR